MRGGGCHLFIARYDLSIVGSRLMGTILLSTVRAKLEASFLGLIDMSDYPSWEASDDHSPFLTRALAAWTLVKNYDAPVKVAAGSVVDGKNDNGVDAVYYDLATKTLSVVQSKWAKNGRKAPDPTECRKFADGIRDLFSGKFKERFNPKINPHWDSIQGALVENVTFRLVIAYTGSDPLAPLAREVLDGLVEELGPEVVTLELLDLGKIYREITASADGLAINLKIMLKEWGKVDSPHVAYYGHANGADISQWFKDHGPRLFTKNIRGLLGQTDVNSEMSQTLYSRPQDFWYFNNGITITADKVTKMMLGGGGSDIACFDCTAIGVVNGAQTVSCLGQPGIEGLADLTKVKVLVRLIETNGDRAFSDDVTKTNNRQNRIEPRDFVSLDPLQLGLRAQLAALNIRYQVHRSDEIPRGSDALDFVEAITALACATADVRHLWQMKREIGKLWEATGKPPYSEIFRSDVTGLHVWRCVQVQRVIDRQLQASKGPTQPIRIHANRLISGLVFSRISKAALSNKSSGVDEEWIVEQVEYYVQQVNVAVDHLFPNGMLPIIVKNLEKCQSIFDRAQRSQGSASEELNLIWS
jgi:hypothetical protein